MPRVVFTPNLERHLRCPAQEVAGTTVRAVMEQVFAKNPVLRGYVLDDQGRLRRHVQVFVDAAMVADRVTLGDPVGDASEVFVMQALSGG